MAAHNGLLHDGLSYWARSDPTRIAVVMDDEDRVTYGDLDRWSDALSAEIIAMGVRAGDNVALAAANCIEWIVAAFAILKSGATVAPFNDRLLGDELHYLAEATQPCLIVADVQRMALLDGAVQDIPRLRLDDVGRYRDAGPPADYRRVRVASDAVAMIIYTSGSTSRPKGAMMGHGNYLAKFHEMRLLDPGFGPGTRSLMPFGLHSSPGLPWGILFTSTLGGTLYFTRKYKAERTLGTLVDARIDFFIGVPMMYDQLSLLPAFADADLSALTFARVGGASAARETLARWHAKGVAVRQLYGMTEMGGGAIIATQEEALAHPDSCGRGLAYTRILIVDDAGDPRAPGEAGHVLLRGPGMMLGYWRDPEATAAALVDGWMHTGDIGSVDGEGYFRFVDRAKEMIKSGGYNVSPAEIEAILMECDGVTETAVFAVADERFGEAACACVFGSDAISAESLFAHCAGRLAGFKLPRYIVVLEQPLPRLANEKVDRRHLKRNYADIASKQARLTASG